MSGGESWEPHVSGRTTWWRMNAGRGTWLRDSRPQAEAACGIVPTNCNQSIRRKLGEVRAKTDKKATDGDCGNSTCNMVRDRLAMQQYEMYSGVIGVIEHRPSGDENGERTPHCGWRCASGRRGSAEHRRQRRRGTSVVRTNEVGNFFENWRSPHRGEGSESYPSPGTTSAGVAFA